MGGQAHLADKERKRVLAERNAEEWKKNYPEEVIPSNPDLPYGFSRFGVYGEREHTPYLQLELESTFEVLPPGEGSDVEQELLPESVHHILKTYYVVPIREWNLHISNIPGNDRSAKIKLEDGTECIVVQRSAYLAAIIYPNGDAVYLARELPEIDEQERVKER